MLYYLACSSCDAFFRVVVRDPSVKPAEALRIWRLLSCECAVLGFPASSPLRHSSSRKRPCLQPTVIGSAMVRPDPYFRKK